MSVEFTDWRGHGLRVTRSVADFEQLGLHTGESDADVVRLHFGLRGDYRVRYPGLERSYDLVGGHHNIFYAKPFKLEFENKTRSLETFGIQFPVRQFVSYVDGASDRLSRYCELIVNGKNGILFEQWGAMTPALEVAIRQIIDCRYEGTLKDLFLLSKSIELLVLSIEANPDEPRAQRPMTATDRERIVAARDLVNERLTNPPSLSEVAKRVGLNEYKLKRGFKDTFGTSVFAYLTEQRLELAKRLLLDTDKSASEVGFELGYATAQHFHNAFKRRFGATPNSVRRKSGKRNPE
jgi:AraC family transcriptional regulator, transcriptional activator of the genes for pyochelin and ferripyochelin receptors